MPTIITRGAGSAVGFGLFGSSAVTDPYFFYNTLLLPGNGTNGAQNNTFLDSSTNNFTITRNGNTTQGTFSPFSQTGWSNYFDGNGDSLTVPSGSSVSGTGNFTVEFFIYPSTIASGYKVVYINDTSGGFAVLLNSTGTLSYGRALVAVDGTTTGTVTFNQWNHVAFVRSGTGANQFVCYINGSSAGSFTNSTSYASGIVRIGTDAGGVSFPFDGYLSNVRSATVAVYTGAFNVPTSPLTATQSAGTNIAAITTGQTSLLTCQSNRFVDNGQGNTGNTGFTITVNGNTSVQAFSPFNPSAPYAAGTIGGSGYFDGSGDSLQTPSNAAFTFGTGDFTLECWAYLSGNYPGVVSGIVDISTSNSTGRLVLDLYSTGYVNIETVGVSLVASNTLLPKNAWSHLVAVRSGTTLSLFQNGTRVGTATNSTNFSFSQAYVGVTSDGYYWSGYLSSVRLVKGTAVYDPSQSTLTVPTAPLTAITNTSLLLNMTNGGIIDNAMMNDLETVGNAQISTSVSKFGGGSMSFNGTNSYMPARPNDTNSFGTGDFTLEAWVYPSAFTSPNSTIACVWASTGYAWYFGLNGSTNVLFGYAGSTVSFAYTFSANNWYHIAITRSSGSVRAFVNGTQVGSTQTITSSLTANSTVLAIGANMDGGPTQYWNGYLDDLRITKGIARYTANFTPPTAAFPLS